MTEPRNENPTTFAIFFNDLNTSGNIGDSFLLPGAVTNGAITLQFRSQIDTTLSPVICLWPLRPILSPPFFAAVVVPSPWRTLISTRLNLNSLATDDSKILSKLPNTDSLFETVLVATNDELVNLYLDKKIKFNDLVKNIIKFINLKEFQKYKTIKPYKIETIEKLNQYVRLKIKNKSV